jgi:hypothetical protein
MPCAEALAIPEPDEAMAQAGNAGSTPPRKDRMMSEDQVAAEFRNQGVHPDIAEIKPRIAALAEIMRQPNLMAGAEFARSKRILQRMIELSAELNAEWAWLDELDRDQPDLREHNATERAGLCGMRDAIRATEPYQFVQRAHWAKHPPRIGRRLLILAEVQAILKILEETRLNTYSDALRDRIALGLLRASFEPSLSDVTLKQTVVRFLK